MVTFNASATGIRRAVYFLFLSALLFPTSLNAEPLTVFKHDGTGIDLTISGAHRTRYETIIEAGPNDNLVSLRSTLLVEAGTERFRIGGELMDARAYGDRTTPFSFFGINDELQNTAEPIQYYLTARFDDIFTDGLDLTLKGGRLTLDLGSGRLFGRNKFRNTINSFRGGQVLIERGNQSLLLFYVNPMDITSDFARGQQMDVPITETDIAGAHYTNHRMFADIKAEAYFYAVKRNFRLAGAPRLIHYTPGLRIWRESQIGQFDFEIEATPQFRQHPQGFAYFAHADVGYSFDTSWRPHVSFLFDIASGQERATIGECAPELLVLFTGCMSQLRFHGDTVFDSLYGLLSDDFGPTGLFRSNPSGSLSFSIGRDLSRRNIISPALRFSASPMEHLSTVFTARGFWREDPLRAVTGFSHSLPPEAQSIEYLPSEVGYQIDSRVSYDIFGEHLKLEVGGAVFFFGSESTESRRLFGLSDPSLAARKYLYTSLTASF